MDPIIGGALIGGGVGLLGSWMGGNSSAKAAREANQSNERIARENRAWSEMMANTAHQREVSDLKKAGLNPILSATKGAMTPGVANPVMQPVDEGKGFAEGLKEISSRVGPTALAAVQMREQVKNNEATRAAQAASTVASLAQAEREKASAQDIRANLGKRDTEIGLLKAQLSSAGAEARGRRAEADARVAEAGARAEHGKIDKDWSKFDAATARILDLVGGAFSALSIGNLFQRSKSLKSDRVIREERHLREQGRKGSRLP